LKKGVVFRVDGNAQIGLGHLVRCIALAQMLCEEFGITFACKEIPENTAVALGKFGFNLLRIIDEEVFLKDLTQDRIIVLDHYAFDSSYQKKIKDSGAILIFIDDLHRMSSYADLIINHSPGITAGYYQAQINTQFALGLEYVLLRPTFLKSAQSDLKRVVKGTVFVCFGGSDSKNITRTVVEILKKDKRFTRIFVVVGEVYASLEDLKQFVSNDDRVEIHHAISSEQICELMSGSELAIVPSSGILQETLAIGCKTISGMYVENQEYIFKRYKVLGAFISAEDFSSKHIAEAVEFFFSNRAQPNKKWIDGKSGIRLLNVFRQLANEDKFCIRLANESDVNKTFEWATDKVIRAYSFSKSQISLNEHSNWFLKKIKMDSCYYFIASVGHKDAGSIRFDLKDDSAVISYLLDSGFHNQGLGIVLLKKGLMALVQMNDVRVKEIVGYVIPENIPSVKAFERLGFEKHFDGENFKFIKKIQK